MREGGGVEKIRIALSSRFHPRKVVGSKRNCHLQPLSCYSHSCGRMGHRHHQSNFREKTGRHLILEINWYKRTDIEKKKQKLPWKSHFDVYVRKGNVVYFNYPFKVLFLKTFPNSEGKKMLDESFKPTHHYSHIPSFHDS